jgi:hypothetical protein
MEFIVQSKETDNTIREKSNKLLSSHFYEENGRIVFTEEYHKTRGYCCGNNCRHCPYEPKVQKGNTYLIKK